MLNRTKTFGLFFVQYQRKLEGQTAKICRCLKHLRELIWCKTSTFAGSQAAIYQTEAAGSSAEWQAFCVWLAWSKLLEMPTCILTSDEGLLMIEQRRVCEIYKYGPARPFERHGQTEMHQAQEALFFEKNNVQLENIWNLQSKSNKHVLSRVTSLALMSEKKNL